jgi:glycosyltransferase involved in cell wall biosynthesis
MDAMLSQLAVQRNPGAEEARDSRIRLACLPHGGFVAARNHALGLATGEFCAVMDSDDVALPERFARQVDYLRQHPEVVCLGGDYFVIDARGRKLILKQARCEPHAA